MNRKFKVGIFTIASSLVVLVGCSGGTVPVEVKTHHLTDVNGVGIEGVRYYCDSNSSKVFTLANGNFNFNPNGDKCKFMLTASQWLFRSCS